MIDADNWLIDVTSGDVVGRTDIDERFEVQSTEAADWVLELRSQIEGDIAGIDARLRAVIEQLQAMRRAKERQLSWWHWRFLPSLTEFARTQLEGRKERTARFTWGSVAFRRTQPRHQIVDVDAAIAWMKDRAPERIKRTETVLMTDVLAVATQDEVATSRWIESTPAGETVRVETGVGDANGKRKG